MAHTGDVGFSSKTTTTLTGGGRSVVGNVTIGFCTAVTAAVLLVGGFVIIHEPVLALIALGFVAFFFLAFLAIILNHAAKYPDAAVTSEENYMHIVGMRMAAQRPEIMADQTLTIAPVEPHRGGADV